MQKDNDFSMDTADNSPLVTVIVRTKNRPVLLAEALSSIVAQTYPKIEIVVVNDGGNDIREIVDRVVSSMTAVQLIQFSESGGRSFAANEGLKRASGEWIAFLDDDDLLAAEHIQHLLEFALLNNAGVVYSGTKVIQVNQDGTTYDVTEYNVPFSHERLLYENFIPIHSVLLHRVIIDNSICFDTNFDFFEDWDFWLQVSQKKAFLHSSAVTAVYRLHNNASGVHQRDKIIDSYFQIYRKWLSDSSQENIFSLLQKSHQWFDDKIADLQDINGKKLDEIGRKHSYALQILRERDAQIKSLTNELDEIKKTVFWRTYKRLVK